MKLGKKILLILFCIIALNYGNLIMGVEIDSSLDDKEYSSSGDNVITHGDYQYILDGNRAYLVGYIPRYDDNGDAILVDTIEVPSSINGISVVGVYTETFAMARVKKIILPATIDVIYENAFINCRDLESIEINGANETYASYDGIIYSKDYTFLVKCPEAKRGEVRVKEGTRYICDYSFFNCRNITKIYIPDSVIDTSDTPDGEGVGIGAFYDTESLSQIEVSSNNKSYSVIGGVLYRLSRSTGRPKSVVKCPDTITGNVTLQSSIEEIEDYAFMDCHKLVGPISLPSNLKTIGEKAFWWCESLNGTITIPSSIVSIGQGAFYSCKSINNLVINNGLINISDDCFAYNESLRSITIPDSVDTIGERAFFNCINVEKIDLGHGVRIIKNWAFDNMYSVKGDLIIPDSVEQIGTAAFYYCSGIDGYIVIGEKVYSIGESAFYFCDKAKGILFKGILPAINEYTFLQPDVNYYYLKSKQKINGNGVVDFEDAFKDKNISTYSLRPEVKFMVNGTTYNTVNLTSYGQRVPQISNPQVNGYEFLGWYYDQNHTKRFNFTDEIMDNTTLYADMRLSNIITFKNKELVIEKGHQEKILFDYDFEDGAGPENIQWTTSDEGVATVDNEGNVTAVEKGNAIITATYKNASASINVRVWKEENIIDFDEESISIEIDEEKDLSYNYHFLNNGSTDDIVWNSSRPNVVKVENGKITGLSEGTAKITATYEDASDEITVNVLKKNVINIKDSEIVMEMNSTYNIDFDYYFNDGATSQDIVWDSTNTNVVKVENGRLVSNLDGNATITAKYKNATASVNVVVKGPDMFRFTKRTAIISYDELRYEIPYVWSSYGRTKDDIIWQSSNQDVATVDHGVVTPLTTGQTVITAICGDAMDTMTINVIRSNELSFAEDNILVRYKANSRLDLDINYYFNNGDTLNNIKFTSDNPDVIKVENNKLIEVGIGIAKITASYGSLSDTISVEIVPEDHITFERIGYILKPGEQLDLPCDYYVYGFSDISFESLDDDIATIDEDGKIIANQEGETTITAVCGNIERKLLIVVSNEEYKRGDVNLDGVVDPLDASCALDIYKYNDADNLQKILADLDYDSQVNPLDASVILDIYKYGE